MAASAGCKPGGADDGDQHDVRIGQRGEFQQTFRAEVDVHVVREQGAQFGFLGGVVNRDVRTPVSRACAASFSTLPAAARATISISLRQLARDLEGRAADGSGGP